MGHARVYHGRGTFQRGGRRYLGRSGGSGQHIRHSLRVQDIPFLYTGTFQSLICSASGNKRPPSVSAAAFGDASFSAENVRQLIQHRPSGSGRSFPIHPPPASLFVPRTVPRRASGYRTSFKTRPNGNDPSPLRHLSGICFFLLCSEPHTFPARHQPCFFC